ncbi:MAG: acetylxylan esterase [Candidatus Omnitrophica bacterium]|nr:acetylxylan esterase [Candidatus Omnitrophota bacterium]
MFANDSATQLAGPRVTRSRGPRRLPAVPPMAGRGQPAGWRRGTAGWRRGRTRGQTGAVCLLIAASGCASLPMRGQTPAPLPLPPEVSAYYEYPRRAHGTTVLLLGERPGLREFLVRFPLAAEEGIALTEPVVEVEWFEATATGRRAAILFNPILGGDYPLERGICRFLAAHGFHVALVHRKTLKLSPEHPVAHIEVLLRQGVLRIRQVVDWMSTHERVDPERLGSFGISMGGIASVVAAAVEPRLRAHVVALAGGSVPDILVASPDRLLAQPRAQYLARNHLDLAALEARLRQEVRTDPLRLAPYVDAGDLFMIIAVFDRTIGRERALRLWRALGRPRVTLLPLGHYTAYLALPYVKAASLRFFRERLAPQA